MSRPMEKTDIEAAIAEAKAQVEMLEALQNLPADSRERVLRALDYILAADRQIPGIFDATTRGLKTRPLIPVTRKDGV